MLRAHETGAGSGRISMDIGSQDGIGGLVWYAECKKLALKHVIAFTPPADGDEMRMYHSLYLTNLLALLDLAREMFGAAVEEEWQRTLDSLGGQSGANNAAYLRELRNAVIHRGTNMTAAGTSVGPWVCALSPVEVRSRSGKKGPFVPFDGLLRNVFATCEAAIGPVILKFASDALVADEETSVEELRETYLQGIDSTPHMPDWVKDMARKHVDEVPFEEVRGFQANKLRLLLTEGPLPGLRLAA
jgi:hypothetical protein